MIDGRALHDLRENAQLRFANLLGKARDAKSAEQFGDVLQEGRDLIRTLVNSLAALHDESERQAIAIAARRRLEARKNRLGF
jgi:hypothetical protein